MCRGRRHPRQQLSSESPVRLSLRAGSALPRRRKAHRLFVKKIPGDKTDFTFLNPRLRVEIERKYLSSKCAPVGIRTSNLLIRSQMLYPVELRALKSNFRSFYL